MLKVLKSGFYTTVQDQGRLGYRQKGVPVSGTMDDLARHRINTLLQNSGEMAVLEITMTGPTLLFEEDTFICLAGAHLSATLNNSPIKNYHVYPVKAGDIISYGRLEKGFRGYLGVKGGLQLPKVLGSSSQYVPLTQQKCLKDGEAILYGITKKFVPALTHLKVDDYLGLLELPVMVGPEFDLLGETQQKQLLQTTFSVAKENDRMAYQLEETVGNHQISMLTSATLPGTVQLTPSGKLIILMKDGQTTGGYPRVLQLTAMAISMLAQKRAGDQLRFVYA